MIVLGLLLLGATGAFTGLLIADNWSGGPDYTVTVLGNDIATMNSVAIFLSGIALTLLLGLGVVLSMGGGVRMRRLADERRRMSAEASRAIADRDALQDRLDQPPTPMPTDEAVEAGGASRATRRAGSHNWFRFGH